MLYTSDNTSRYRHCPWTAVRQIEIAEEVEPTNVFLRQMHYLRILQDESHDESGKNNRDGEMIRLYPYQTSYATVAKINTLEDKLYMAVRPCKSKKAATIPELDPPNRSSGEELQKFVGGGYTPTESSIGSNDNQR